MFTGIIESVGVVRGITRDTANRSAARMVVDLRGASEGLRQGQSVALNGVCLTAVELSGTECSFDLVEETVRRTSLGDLTPGSVVNVERSLAVGDRLEGHFVLGHVDGRAVITRIKEKRGEVRMWFRVPKRLAKYVIKKGSVTLDGISLTVVSTTGRVASVSLIPHTLDVTNLSTRRVGDKINIEADVLSRYVLD